MYSKLRLWMIQHQDQISWFIIGMMTTDGLSELLKEDYTGAILCFGLAYVNYLFTGVRLR